jgi:hypothetical protein
MGPECTTYSSKHVFPVVHIQTLQHAIRNLIALHCNVTEECACVYVVLYSFSIIHIEIIYT